MCVAMSLPRGLFTLGASTAKPASSGPANVDRPRLPSQTLVGVHVLFDINWASKQGNAAINNQTQSHRILFLILVAGSSPSPSLGTSSPRFSKLARVVLQYFFHPQTYHLSITITSYLYFCTKLPHLRTESGLETCIERVFESPFCY